MFLIVIQFLQKRGVQITTYDGLEGYINSYNALRMEVQLIGFIVIILHVPLPYLYKTTFQNKCGVTGELALMNN